MKNNQFIIIKYVLIFSFISWLSFNLSSQSKNDIALYEVTYVFSIDRKMTKFDEGPVHIQQTALEVEQKLTQATSVLLCSYHQALNYVKGNFTKGEASNIAKILVRYETRYYTDLFAKIFLIEKSMPGEIKIEEDLYTILWEITDETTEINGMICKKALGTLSWPGFKDDKVTVWFTPEIPIPFGPHGMHGLPGLILQYKHASLVLTAEKIRDISLEQRKIVMPVKK